MTNNHFLTPIGKKKERVTITIRNAYLLWPNFSGKPTKFNPDGGDRTFNILMNEEDGKILQSQGWNVSVYEKSADDEDPNVYYKLPVAVKYNNFPPRLWLIGGDHAKDRVMLDEDTVDYLDRLQYEKVDMVIAGSQWSVRGNSGMKAYIQSGFFTIYVDELEKEYGVVQSFGGLGITKAEDEQPALPAGDARQYYDYDGEVVD